MSDMVVGALCGFAVALTLHAGARRIAGFALITLFVAAVGVEAGWLVGLANRNGSSDSSTDESPRKRGSQNNRRVDETESPDFRPSPSPSPRTTQPSEDTSEIAAKRAKAHELLDPLGPLPGPSSDADLRAKASALAEELADFDKHWTGNASVDLDLEIGQLYLIDHQLVIADRSADAARQLLPQRPPRGSATARRLAQALGTLGLIALEQKNDVEARNDFARAAEVDSTLPEPHFYLGKLTTDPERRKAQLKAFVDLVGPSPPPSQADVLPEAKALLGQ